MLLFARPETCHGWNVFETTSRGLRKILLCARCGQQQLAHGAASPTGLLGTTLIKARDNQGKAGPTRKPDTGLPSSIGQEQGFRGQP